VSNRDHYNALVAHSQVVSARSCVDSALVAEMLLAGSFLNLRAAILRARQYAA
jgi:hypothetical protein